MSIDHGLGDSRRFARDLEDAYVEMLGNIGSPARLTSIASRRIFRQREHDPLAVDPASRSATR